MGALFNVAIFVLNIYAVFGSPLVLEKSSPNGHSVIAISSSDPEFEKRFGARAFASASSSGGGGGGGSGGGDSASDRGGVVQSFSFSSPGKSVVGTGRGFSTASASNYNPWQSPFFLWPSLNFDDYDPYSKGFNDDFIKSVESYFDDSNFNFGDGDIKTVSAVNDNGHVYGKVNNMKFDNKKPPFIPTQKVLA